MGKIKKDETIKYIWYGAIFIFMFVWFSKIHPLVPFDGDDWGHLSFARRAVPELTLWNPAKLFPEIFMSFVSSIAAYTIAPIMGNYVLSITLMSALVTSGFIAIYIYSLGSCLRRIFKISLHQSIIIEILFLILHFLIFRQGDSDNTYLFYCVDLNCYYNYLMPALMNASLVLFMIKNEEFDKFLKNGNGIVKGLLLVAVYFAVFSNLVDSVILSVYAGCMIIISLVDLLKKKHTWIEFLRKNWLYLAILLFWIISAICELSGGRAALAEEHTGAFVKSIVAVMQGLITVITWMHKMFILVAGVLALTAFVLCFFEKNKEEIKKTFVSQIIFWSIMATLTMIYTIIICAKVSVGNIYRSEYLFALFFFVLVILMFCLAYTLSKIPQIMVCLPLALCILITYVNTNLHTFKESNYLNVSGKLCMQMTEDLVNEVIDADLKGASSIELKVSSSGHDANWPQSYAMGESMAITLYKHGVVSRMIDITIAPSEEYNDKYQIYQ